MAQVEDEETIILYWDIRAGAQVNLKTGLVEEVFMNPSDFGDGAPDDFNDSLPTASSLFKQATKLAQQVDLGQDDCDLSYDLHKDGE
ncbi:MAG: hypothetical protein H0X39_05515 [Actinobacteria bacterium]|nr:hypothetical protein [Actinomycetota bacterium]